LGEIVASPFEVNLTAGELSKLAKMLKALDGEIKVVMVCTGSYHLPIAYALNEDEMFVSIVNPLIARNYDNNSIRKSRNDKADAIKTANYTLTNWLKLPQYIPEEDIRHMLKVYSRQYNKYKKIHTMLKNNLISLLDSTFPGANKLFTSGPRKSDGHEKWVDFAACFWHCKCVSSLSQKAFTERYREWCKRAGYNFSVTKSEDVFIESLGHFYIIPKNETTKRLIAQATLQINTISETVEALAREMKALAATLPEYPAVMEFRGVGDILRPQLIAVPVLPDISVITLANFIFAPSSVA